MYCYRYVEELVQAEVDGGLPSDKVVVAGFSQGGAIALQLLRSDKKLAGIVGEEEWRLVKGALVYGLVHACLLWGP